MRSEALKKLLRREPCPLLRLHLSNGLTFAINDPDLVLVTSSTVELLLPPDAAGPREAVINLLHIIWVEVLTPPVP
jgi:hypothetical protein